MAVAVVSVDLEMAVAGIVDEAVGAAVALLVGGVAATVEGVGAGGAVEMGHARRTGGCQTDQLRARQRRTVGKARRSDAERGVRVDVLVKLAVKLDPVTGDAVGDEQVAELVACHGQLRGGNARAELKDGGGDSRAVVLVDLQGAVAAVVDECVRPAVSMLVGGEAVALEGIRRGRAVQQRVGRRPRGRHDRQLRRGQRRPVGEVHRRHADAIIERRRAVQQAVDLDPVPSDAVGQDDVARGVSDGADLRGGQPGADLQHRRTQRGAEGIAVFVDLQVAVARIEDEGVGAAVALHIVGAALAVEGLGA